MFGKKPAVELPVDRVRAMMRSGMSEKDIVRQLKAENFSFGEIEKALMAAVKEGASPLPSGGEFGIPPGPAQYQEPVARPPQPEPEPEEREPPRPAPVQMRPAPVAYRPAPQAYPAYLPEEDLMQPEVVMEELIESVAEEKFEKFTGEVKNLRVELEAMRSRIADVRRLAETKPAPELPKDLSDRLDTFEGRLGGLEKAFKQFMPLLAENLEVISKWVAERKRTQPQPRQAPPRM